MINKNVDDPAYEQIKQKIIDGEYAPTQRLVEANLSQELGVSRHKVRAALERLHLDGLVHIEPNRGATVMSLELPEVLDILMAREVLEGGVAYLA
ncbi:MAG: GntR family transcriptional regulator, partial [Anaerolineales bacterium]|nr:GntR family transcriptional regulator [Anaerolineales bacterium]